ncbi:hypothetical protein Q5692_22195 [Microcoleus sp. C2C3]|uniref:hypothetical protein n=1 Tax=Microcoleus sp. C2C3 TaxID=3055324 RepID=UPI002FCFA2E2
MSGRRKKEEGRRKKEEGRKYLGGRETLVTRQSLVTHISEALPHISLSRFQRGRASRHAFLGRA